MLGLEKKVVVGELLCEGSQFFGPLPGLPITHPVCVHPKTPGCSKQIGPITNLASKVTGAVTDRFNLGLRFTKRHRNRRSEFEQ
jgi:hypothetical protein